VSLPHALGEIRASSCQTLGELSDGRSVLVVFLRHLGCTFCREALADIARRREAIESEGVRIVLVHMGTDEQAETLFRRYGLADVARVSDPQQRLYEAFELQRARPGQLFGWREVVRGLAATLRGHGVGRLMGDARQMPGVFLVRDRAIIRQFRHRHASDRPDYGELACGIGVEG